MRAPSWVMSQCLILAVMLSSILNSPLIARSASPSRTLEPFVTGQAEIRDVVEGVPVERSITGGETHHYRLTLEKGQFLNLVVDQDKHDLTITLYDPAEKKVDEADSPGNPKVIEPILTIAETTGSYRLTINARNPAASGKYVVKIADRRAAVERDRIFIQAKKLTVRAEKTRNKFTAETLRQAVGLYQAAIALWPRAENPREEAYARHGLGRTYETLSETQASLETYHQALPLWQAAGDAQGEAMTLSNLALIYSFRSENIVAEQYYLRALPLRRIAQDRSGEGFTLAGLGAIYGNVGETLKAKEYFDQVLEIAQQLQHARLKGIALQNLSVIAVRLGEYQKALDYAGQSLEFRLTQPNKNEQALTLSMLGNIYSDLGDYQQALDYHERALPLARESGNRRDQAEVLCDLGWLHGKMGKAQAAIDYLNQALLISRSLADLSLEAKALRYLGNIYDSKQDHQQALEHYAPALQVFRRVGNRLYESGLLTSLGRVHTQLKQYAEATRYFEESLAIKRELKDSQGEAVALAWIARIEADRNNLLPAKTAMEQAIRLIEQERSGIRVNELKATYLASQRDYFDTYIDLLMRLSRTTAGSSYAAEALVVSEKSRARALTDLLKEARAAVRDAAAPQLVDRERALQQRINDKSGYLTRTLNEKRPAETIKQAENDLATVINEYRDVQAQLRARSPRYVALTQPEMLSLSQIQQLLDEQTILLEYALGNERSYLWMVTPTSLESFELPARSVIQTAAKRAYELLLKSGQREFRVQSQLAIAELSRLVLSPVANRLGDKRLLIVSDGALQYIPFGALTKPVVSGRTNGQPLIVNHEIVSLPSASILSVLRQEIKGRKQADLSVAVFADPVFRNDDQRVAQAIARKTSTETQPLVAVNTQPAASSLVRSANEAGIGELPRLPFTRQEAEAIASASGAQNNFKALDFVASRSTVAQAELSRYRILHFATHGLLNSQHPELSGLVLSLVDEQGQPQDGFLRLHDIYNLNLGAEMVVLSACRTALGQEVNGEGLIGLTRGFMFAGASRVVASLWDVKDEATAELMKRFYQKMLKEGRPPAAALREAQLSMLREKRWEAPYYWASFTLQGEWK